MKSILFSLLLVVVMAGGVRAEYVYSKIFGNWSTSIYRDDVNGDVSMLASSIGIETNSTASVEYVLENRCEIPAIKVFVFNPPESRYAGIEPSKICIDGACLNTQAEKYIASNGKGYIMKIMIPSSKNFVNKMKAGRNIVMYFSNNSTAFSYSLIGFTDSINSAESICRSAFK